VRLVVTSHLTSGPEECETDRFQNAPEDLEEHAGARSPPPLEIALVDTAFGANARLIVTARKSAQT
jgi:hypothetical protein